MAAPASDLPSLDATLRLQLALRVAQAANERRMDEGLLHPELRVASVPGVAPSPGFTGLEGFRHYLAEAEAHDFLAQAAINAAEVTPAGNVLATGALIVTAHGETESVPAWFVYRFRDDLVCAIETHLGEAEGRAAAERAQI